MRTTPIDLLHDRISRLSAIRSRLASPALGGGSVSARYDGITSGSGDSPLRRVLAVCTRSGIPLGLLFATLMAPVGTSGAEAVAVQTAKLVASDAATNDGANTVGIDEAAELVIMGDGQRVRGAAYLFERDLGGPDAWGERKRFVAPDGFDYDRFGRSPQISGDILAINNRPGGNSALTTGSVYLYERHRGGENNWGFVTQISGVGDDQFANTFDLDEDLLVVGAPWDDELHNDAGACYIISRHQGGPDNWGVVRKLGSPDAAPGEEFGYWPQLSGDTLAVTAKQDEESGERSLSAYIFERDRNGPDEWGFVTRIRPSVDGPYDFGNTLAPPLAVEQDTLVLGIPWDDSGGNNVGGVFVYERDHGGSNAWGLVKRILPTGAQPWDRCGSRVAIHGDLIAASAFGDFNTPLAGAVYLFQRDAGGSNNWGQIAKIVPSDGNSDNEAFGCCRIAFQNGLLAVPAWLDDAAVANSGSVFLFQVFDLPQLVIGHDANLIHVEWEEVPGVSFSVEQTPSLQPPMWNTVSEGMKNTSTLPATESMGFVRLRVDQP